MRCPKCGYISFDHLTECRKCHKNIEAVSGNLYGTAYNVQAPIFLNLHRQEREEDLEEMELAEEATFGDDDEYIDDELAILVEGEDEESEGDIGFSGGQHASPQLSVADEQDEDGEIEIDFSRFEAADDSETNSFDEEEVAEAAEEDDLKEFAMKIDMPDALSDISDLAPPAKTLAEDELPAEEPADEEFAEMSLDDLNFDLGLDDLDKDQASPDVHEEAMLALDEIDFSEFPAANSSETTKETGNTDMDLDLDFELDLGGLSIHKDV